MADRVSLQDAAEQLPELVARANAGEEVVITDGGREVARLVGTPEPEVKRKTPRKLGMLSHLGPVPEDFDDPLPEEVLRAFRGE